MTRGSQLLRGVAALLCAAGTALGVDTEYKFDTDSGQVTPNGQPVSEFEGVPLFDLGVFGLGIRSWAIFGT